ncbi:MAG: hypothetical protein HEP70_03490 [Rhodobiaceae bacterium]|nr:hypothetical protein [Rhodobiaceae bacterium]
MSRLKTRTRRSLPNTVLLGALLVSLGACAAPNGNRVADVTPGATPGPQETLEQRVERLERDLATLRIDYSVVRPSMERIVSAESGIEARLQAIEGAFGPITASISPEAANVATYSSPTATVLPTVGIHLASYRDTENVKRGWNELVAGHGDLLSDLDLKVVDYRSAHDGLYRRLVAGPVDPAAAESRCASLKDRGIWCQVVPLERQ